MSRYYSFLLLAFLILVSCKTKDDTKLDAAQIVNRAINASGGLAFNNSYISFDFRDKHYKATRNDGHFTLERHFKDSLHSIKDVLSNTGFKRFIDNEIVKVPDSMVTKYSNSVNSVHYFSVLPFGLNDEAVNKSYLGTVDINGKSYYKIKVTFDEEGGGQDFEDIFIYWIGIQDYKVDYLAYSFHVNGGGMRFRQAFNERVINGIRLVDYYNFSPTENGTFLENLDLLFQENDLKLLSTIELKNINVELLN